MSNNCATPRKKQFTFKWQLKFICMIVFTALLFLLKVVIGQVTNSMALVADSFHMITDFAALTVGYIALRVANSQTEKAKLASEKFTFGWIRAEVLGGLINTVFLFALCFSVMVSSLKRFVQPEEISHPVPVLVAGVVSLVVNFIGLFWFRLSRDNMCQWCFTSKPRKSVEEVSLMSQAARENASPVCDCDQKRKSNDVKELIWQEECQTPHNLNIRGVYLHILEHFLASFIVIVSALIVKFVDDPWTKYVDPAFTMIVVLMILHSTVPLFRETIILFMQSVPANIKVQDMEERLMRRVPSILSVHEFHVWQLAGDQLVASAHFLFKQTDDYKTYADDVERFFRDEGIACMTFQPEFLPKEYLDDDGTVCMFAPTNECFNKCSKDDKCVTLTCCGKEKNDNTCSNRRSASSPVSTSYETGM